MPLCTATGPIRFRFVSFDSQHFKIRPHNNEMNAIVLERILQLNAHQQQALMMHRQLGLCFLKLDISELYTHPMNTMEHEPYTTTTEELVLAEGFIPQFNAMNHVLIKPNPTTMEIRNQKNNTSRTKPLRKKCKVEHEENTLTVSYTTSVNK